MVVKLLAQSTFLRKRKVFHPLFLLQFLVMNVQYQKLLVYKRLPL